MISFRIEFKLIFECISNLVINSFGLEYLNKPLNLINGLIISIEIDDKVVKVQN